MSIKDKLPAGTQLGFGTAPLGNMFRNIPEDEALATVKAAWDQGVRYFDTARYTARACPKSASGTRSPAIGATNTC